MVKECAEIQELVDDTLQNMGLDQEEQEKLLNTILNKLAVPFKLIGYAGVSIFTLVKHLSKHGFGKEDPLIKDLKKEVDSALTMYIQTDLNAARNSLEAT